MHLSYAQIPRHRLNHMDLKEVFRFVSPQVREAAVRTATRLDRLGIRYALAGDWRWALTDTCEPRSMSISWLETRRLNIRDPW
jgi:hypothetical protein